MRGQSALNRLRMEGYRSRVVWLVAVSGECSTATFSDAENSLQWNGMPEVHVAESDNVGGLDFRPLTGTTVLLQGADRDRLRAIYKRLRMFSPARVITSDGSFLHDTGAL